MAAPLQAVMRHVQASYWLFNKLFENRSVFAFVFIFVKRFFWRLRLLAFVENQFCFSSIISVMPRFYSPFKIRGSFTVKVNIVSKPAHTCEAIQWCEWSPTSVLDPSANCGQAFSFWLEACAWQWDVSRLVWWWWSSCCRCPRDDNCFQTG